MKQVTLNVPDKKLVFFIELAKQLGFEITNQEDTTIPDWQKKLAKNRLKELDLNPEKGIDFNDLMNGLGKKYDL